MPGATRATRRGKPKAARSDESNARGAKAGQVHSEGNDRPAAKATAHVGSTIDAGTPKAAGRAAEPVKRGARKLANAGADAGSDARRARSTAKPAQDRGGAEQASRKRKVQATPQKPATQAVQARPATTPAPQTQAAQPRPAATPAPQTQAARPMPAQARPTQATAPAPRATPAPNDAAQARARKAAARRAPKREPHPQAAAASRHDEPIHVPGGRLGALQAEYLARLGEFVRSASAPEPADRRFAGDAWRQGPYAWTASLYLLNEEFMKRLAGSVEGGDEKTRERIRFATEQWLAAISPANFLLTNPEAQRRVLETQGESLRSGIGNLLTDLQRGRISQTDESAFEVGVNVATTPGSVVFENELIQLIQYAPTTETVGSRPLLMIPPCINKFYILDLQPQNSLVAYAVAQGHTVFVVSWRNVHADQGHLGWDDYLELGVVEPVRVAREICDVDRINALGFCVGGTLLSAGAAVLAGRGDDWIESMTLLTSFIDFSRPGSIGVFIDEHQVAYRESTIGSGGIMPGRELALTFNYLRPNDLVWNYVVANYLKGEPPPAFDLLYWNADSTNLPGPMYCWYLRHMYLQNELRQPGRLTCLDVPLDVGEIGVPTYIYASREDHIVPWQGAYESTQLLSGPLRFVLGASGHIAGVINPPAKGKRSHWLGENLPEDAEEWFAQASERPGSWWPDWAQWLSAFAGEQRRAPSLPGNARYRAIEPAPGRYVKEKAG